MELLMSIMLGSLVLTAIFSLFITQSKQYSSQENSVEMVQGLRASMDLMTREIRLAACDPTGAGGIGFQDNANDNYNTDANSIRFTLDTTGTAGTGEPDGLVDGPNEDINYYLYTSGGIQKLGRRTGGSGNPQPVIEDVTNLTFTYYDANGATTSTLSDIRSVQISLTAQTERDDPLLGVRKTMTQICQIRVRNAGLD